MSMQSTDEGKQLPPFLIAKWDDTLADGSRLTENCIWTGKNGTTAVYPITIEWEKEIGFAHFATDRRGVTAYPTILDRDAYMDHPHVQRFNVRWKPQIAVDEFEWRDDGKYVIKARITGMSLVPKTIALPSAHVHLRAMETGA